MRFFSGQNIELRENRSGEVEVIGKVRSTSGRLFDDYRFTISRADMQGIVEAFTSADPKSSGTSPTLPPAHPEPDHKEQPPVA